jgi:hypothetical protein
MGIEPTQGKSGSPTATGADATHPLWVAFADGVTGALLKAYDAVVAAGALILRVQHVDAAGKVQPAGDDPARPVHVAAIGPTTGAETLYAEQTGNGASQAALAANALRKKATIANAATSTTPLWIGQGVAAEANKGIRVDPGGAYNWDALNPFLGAINVYAAVTATWSRSES